ncbi:MAG: hypothetical protein UZ15_CFX003002200 [Chloroflexi bacterium OLB15]|nr:MAG: hypothetical protein UZ15_CFX003002200 [Chloroflexi bacterium OLB15]
MASINWVKYRVGEQTVEIYNLDQAHYFRLTSKGDESQVTFEVQGDKFHIMRSVDLEAYQAVMDYIRSVTGHTFE